MPQPVDTKIMIPNGRTRWNHPDDKFYSIQNLVTGNKVVGYSKTDSAWLSSGREIFSANKSFYNGDLINISVGSNFSRFTPDHVCYASMKPLEDLHAVYLMRRGNQFRIGKAKMSYVSSCGVAARMRSEGADCSWILDTYVDQEEAFFWEQAISGRFGLPQLMFCPKKMTRASAMESLPKCWEFIGDNTNHALTALKHFGRCLDYPLFISDTKINQSGKRPFPIRACNLLNGVKVLPYIRRCNEVHSRKIDWLTATITREPYKGDLVSLETEFYVADGILTKGTQ